MLEDSATIIHSTNDCSTVILIW